jgi:hypothetical protein
LKDSLTAKLLQRQPAAAATPQPRAAEDVRAAVLGDVATLEKKGLLAAADSERRMRIFFAATKTDASLERDAVS